MSKTVAVAYVPVIHKGYVEFFKVAKEKGAEELWLVGDSVLETHEELDYLNRKDRLRAVELAEMKRLITGLDILPVKVMEVDNLNKASIDKILVPCEDISELLVNKYFPEAEVERLNIFLRRDKSKVTADKIPEAESVDVKEFQEEIWGSVFAEAAKSADWWRQVGAALVKDGELIAVAHNEHMPEEQLSNIEGDVRSLFKKGININYVTAAHAETVLIAEAAKQGITTDDAELYVTDFPCPYCARMIAKSGIKTVYFAQGYAVLDGDEFLKTAGIDTVHVNIKKERD